MSNIPTCTEAVMRRRDRLPAGPSHSGTAPVQLAGWEGQGQGLVQGREDGQPGAGPGLPHSPSGLKA